MTAPRDRPVTRARRTGTPLDRLIPALWGAAMLLAAPLLAAQQPPNVVLILVDDLAYTDLGAYGSEIATPNIDALASQGVLFTNHHASPMCAPSRAMLMTGLDSHRTGLANLPETMPEDHIGQPGYTGILEPQVTTIASRLKKLNYRNYMTGKWHLGHTPDTLPSARGFDRTFIMDATGADNWEKRSYMPFYETAPWFEDGQPTELPEDFYSSAFLVDRMIDYIDSDTEQPFFSYLAFLAVHIPVQAPREFSDRYRGRYDTGWAELRRQRREGAIAKGVIDADTSMAPMLEPLRKWEALDTDIRALLAARMEVYAGMVEAMDFHVGRLIKHLKASGRYDNTIFILTSDNGPEGADPVALSRSYTLWLRATGYRLKGEDLGERGTFAYIGPEFASAAAGPLSYFKFHAGEGGVRVPLLMSGPGIAPQYHRSFSFITDIAPTILDLAGGHTAEASEQMTGRSLLPVVTGQADATYSATTETGFETAGQAGLFRGDLKLVRNAPPYGDNVWRLYDIVLDPGETQDMSASHPELFASMMQAWERYVRSNGVLPVPQGYLPTEVMTRRTEKILRKRHGPKIVLGLIVLSGLTALFVIRRRRRR